ncbi:hypothetical protein JRQ81_003341 [Phrynocephalus forsythii]|uniref:Uncharacterized protein n=1 Tax=Phrynocephalus forsythii TaxID=171643 RepID=A0A9Q0XJK6_9SAUR|nr:hypothetical protein JRQ81_003341 [Phrynocephalus forsythii]
MAAAAAAAASKPKGQSKMATCALCQQTFKMPTAPKVHEFCYPCFSQLKQKKASAGRRSPWDDRKAKQEEDRKEERRTAEKGPGLCEEHGKKPVWFCHQEATPICEICKASELHTSHLVTPIEDAIQEYKDKLQHVAYLLDEQLKESQKQTYQEGKKTAAWKAIYRQKQQIEGEFYKLHAFLDEEEKRLLKRLKNEERETLKQLHRNLEQLSKQTNSLGEMIAEVKKKSWKPNVELLKGMQKTLKRCENVVLVKIEPVPTELSLVYNIPSTDIMEILSHFKVGLSLDPATAHPSLVVSKDRKSVQYKRAQQQGPPKEDKAERFDTYLLVLSSERFTWGRRYWEVEVGDSKEWDLGVCRESVGRKGQAPIMSPFTGFWRLWLRNGSQLKALNSYPTPLPMKLKPTRVGVFLDYLGAD